MQDAIFVNKLTVDGSIASSQNALLKAPFYYGAAAINIAAGTGGAISLLCYKNTINSDAGGDAFTLASGLCVGQMKYILFVADGGGDAVVTGAFPGGDNTLTFSDAGEYALLMWDGTDWQPLSLGSEGTFTDAPVLSTV